MNPRLLELRPMRAAECPRASAWLNMANDDEVVCVPMMDGHLLVSAGNPLGCFALSSAAERESRPASGCIRWKSGWCRRRACPASIPPHPAVPELPAAAASHKLSVEDVWGLTPWDRRACRDLTGSACNEGIFTPLGWRRYSEAYPGTAGGQNWGGAAYDADHNALIMTLGTSMVNKIMPHDAVSTGLKGDTDSRYTRRQWYA